MERGHRGSNRRKRERESAKRAEHRERLQQAQQKRNPDSVHRNVEEPPKMFVTAGQWLTSKDKL
jgi:hypothetical protein